MLGFGIIANAVFIILTTLISFLVSRYVFLEKEEAILEQNTGSRIRNTEKLLSYDLFIYRRRYQKEAHSV